MILKRFLNKNNIQKPDFVIKRGNTNGKIIELIGPSGVGKSTLYNTLKDRLVGDWGSLNTVKTFQNQNNDERLAELHWMIFKHKFYTLESLNASSHAKLDLVEYFKNVLSTNIKLLQFRNEKGVFLEEGICHNFSLELLQLNKEDLFNILGKRYLISLLPKDPKIIVHQIRKRTLMGGHTVFHHVGLNDIELEELTKKSIENFKDLIDYLKKCSVPIFELSVEDGIDVNSKKIIKIERTILNE